MVCIEYLELLVFFFGDVVWIGVDFGCIGCDGVLVVFVDGVDG